MKRFMKDFNSIQEFINYITVNPTSNIFKNRELSSQGTGYQAELFTQTDNFEEALNLLKYGWSEGAKRISTKFNETRPQMINRSKSFTSPVGYQAHIPNYLNNSPLSMINKKMVKVKAPVITIVRNISVPGRIGADTILEQGIEFLKYISDLENKGQRAKVIIQEHYTDAGDQENILRIVIKHPDELLHIGKLAFPIAHPSMLRRITFRFTEVDPDSCRYYTNTYGRPVREPYLKKGEILYNTTWRETI